MKKLIFLPLAYFGLLAIPFAQSATTNAFAATTTSDQTTVALVVTKQGKGTVTGEGINCGADCSEMFPIITPMPSMTGGVIKEPSIGKQIDLVAIPDPNHYTAEWSGCNVSFEYDDRNRCSVGNSVMINFMKESTAVTVTFKPLPTITVTKPLNGIITGNIQDCNLIESSCSVVISLERMNSNFSSFTVQGLGDNHPITTLKAIPNEGYQLVRWSGIKDVTGGIVTWGDIKNGATITAIFEPKYAVTVTKEGKGTVQGQTLENNAVNMGIMCGSDCNESYNADTSLTLTATSDSGYVFKGWSGATCSGTGACTIKVTQPLNISALFESTTPTPTTTTPDPTKPFSASLSFAPLKQLYRPGDKLEVDLNAKLNAPTQFERVDLWVVISAPHLLPKDHYLFMTPKPFEIFSTEPQALKFDLERLDQAVRVLTFDIIPGFGGQYTLFAAFVKSGKNPFTDGFLVLKSEIAIAEVIFTND